MKHKDEALKALASVRERLGSDEPLEGLGRRMLLATLDYAVEQVTAIQEVQRARKAKP